MKNPLSLTSWLLCCTLIIGVAFAYPRWEKETINQTLSWDVMGYYLYLPATFIYQDLQQLEFKDQILKEYQPTTGFYQAYRHEKSGNYVLKYSIGLSVLYLPFFLIAHALALAGDYPPDGFSYPYQLAISWGSILIALLGLWLSRKVLLHYFNDKVTAIALLLLVFGTNYLNYTAIDHAMTHNYEFTLYALMILFSIHFYQNPSFKWAALIGGVLGLAALTRPTEIVMVLIPLMWGIESLQKRFNFFKIQFPKLLLAVAITITIGSVQLFYWKYATGDWLVYSYQDQGFSWLHPHLGKGMLSYQKGWLTYTPMMIFSLIGFVFLHKKWRTIFWAALLFFIVNTYIVFAWDIWWYGGSLGQRAMVQSYAVLLFPLAAFIQYFLTWKPFKQLIISILFLGFIWFNGMITYQAHGGGLDPDGMTRAYFWRLFGNLNITDEDKKLLDTNEDYRGERANVRTLFFENFDSLPDTTMGLSRKQVHSGEQSIVVWRDLQKTNEFAFPTGQFSEEWLRVNAKFFAPYKEWDKWKMCRLIVKFRQENTLVKERMIRVFRIYNQGSWGDVFIDVKAPKADFDNVVVMLNNSGSDKEVFMDDVRIEVFDEK